MLTNLYSNELLLQLQKYPRQKVPLLTEYLYVLFQKNTAGINSGLLSARDLTETYGVSKVTALKVLNEVARRMGSASNKKRILRNGSRKKILVCSDSLGLREKFFTYNQSSFTVDREHAINRLIELGFKPELVDSEKLMSYDFENNEIAGLLLKGGKSISRFALERGIPAVEIQVGTVEPSFVHSVSAELMHANMEILDLWKERPEIIVCGMDERIGKERFESFFFSAECRKMGDKLHPCFVPMIAGDLGQLAGYKYGMQIVKTRKNPILLSVSDYFSFGLLSAFMENKWRPKKDYELISVDNLESLGQQPFGEPLLTTVDLSRLVLYDTGAELLADLIRNRTGYDNLITMRQPAKLIRRQTA